MIRQNPVFPTNTPELAREMGVLWRELATELKAMTKIKSIQTGWVNTADVTAGTNEDGYYKDITISAVTVAKCVVTVQGRDASVSMMQTGRLTGPTTLRVSRDDSNPIIAGRWTVIEYDF